MRTRSQKSGRMAIEIAESKYLQHLLFTVDQVIITHVAKDANYVCKQLLAEYRNWGLKLNFRTTEYLINDLDELYTDGKKSKRFIIFVSWDQYRIGTGYQIKRNRDADKQWRENNRHVELIVMEQKLY